MQRRNINTTKMSSPTKKPKKTFACYCFGVPSYLIINLFGMYCFMSVCVCVCVSCSLFQRFHKRSAAASRPVQSIACYCSLMSSTERADTHTHLHTQEDEHQYIIMCVHERNTYQLVTGKTHVLEKANGHTQCLKHKEINL